MHTWFTAGGHLSGDVLEITPLRQRLLYPAQNKLHYAVMWSCLV